MCVISEKDVKEMYIRGQSDDPAVILCVSFKPGQEQSNYLSMDFMTIGIRTLRDAAQGLECP